MVGVRVESITQRQALEMLTRVHRRVKAPDRQLVVGYARNMADADAVAGGPSWLPSRGNTVVVSTLGGLIFGSELLLAAAYVGRSRTLRVQRDASWHQHRDEIDLEVEPAAASNGVQLTTLLAIQTWVEDPGPDAGDK